jgi:hypothetical protein
MENATMQVAAEPEGKRPLGKKTKPQMGQPYRHPGRRDAEAAGKDTTVLETPGARADRQARGVPTPNRLFAGSPSFTPGRAQAAEAVGQRGLEEQLGSLSLGTREQRNNRERRQGEGKAGARPQRKPKNTECFEPDASTDMRLVFGRHSQKSLKQDRGDYHVKDVCMVPDLLCAEDDMETYHALLAELSAACPEGGPEAGLSLAKGRDGLWATWHGDTHVIADDKKMGGKWKRLSPTFGRVVERMAEYFDMDVKATRLNWYRPGSEDWCAPPPPPPASARARARAAAAACHARRGRFRGGPGPRSRKPYHHDRAAFTPNCPQARPPAPRL